MTTKRYTLKTRYKKLLADTHTPVSIYLKLRDRYANPILLESSDYHGHENSFSYICFQPLARFEVQAQTLHLAYPDGQQETLAADHTLIEKLQAFSQVFEAEPDHFSFPQNGLFGYTTYDAVRYFEDLPIQDFADAQRRIPEMLYQVYGFVIAINHFKNELYLFEHRYGEGASQLEEVERVIHSRSIPQYHFEAEGPEAVNMQDEDYCEAVRKGIYHCQRGDVFQIVLSRRFAQDFKGDEFNVYRALRSINPSPYLFYFDYGNFKIFGSSPEAQIKISHNQAEIHPIAGTFKRTGNDKEDAEMARKLFDDPKENAEHVMLVDLARNDLSRNGYQVQVETFKEIQFYSHLIHLVSIVSAQITPGPEALRLFADTFPAGTLSGAPKYKAMALINAIEPQNRGYYGGAIGFMSFQGDVNHAIMIRSFLSKNNRLFFQAGAGIVSKSSPESELEEVNNKLRALRTAIQNARTI
ncbi:MAG: anthranilate synthase component I family protein [Microscillaceae bacterium]